MSAIERGFSGSGSPAPALLILLATGFRDSTVATTARPTTAGCADGCAAQDLANGRPEATPAAITAPPEIGRTASVKRSSSAASSRRSTTTSVLQGGTALSGRIQARTERGSIPRAGRTPSCRPVPRNPLTSTFTDETAPDNPRKTLSRDLLSATSPDRCAKREVPDTYAG